MDKDALGTRIQFFLDLKFKYIDIKDVLDSELLACRFFTHKQYELKELFKTKGA